MRLAAPDPRLHAGRGRAHTCPRDRLRHGGRLRFGFGRWIDYVVIRGPGVRRAEPARRSPFRHAGRADSSRLRSALPLARVGCWRCGLLDPHIELRPASDVAPGPGRFGHCIRVPGMPNPKDGRRYDLVDPTTGAKLGSTALMAAKKVERAPGDHIVELVGPIPATLPTPSAAPSWIQRSTPAGACATFSRRIGMCAIRSPAALCIARRTTTSTRRSRSSPTTGGSCASPPTVTSTTRVGVGTHTT